MVGTILEQLAVMFAIIGIGFLLRGKQIVSDRFQKDLSEFVVRLALPCSIIESGMIATDHSSLSSVTWAL